MATKKKSPPKQARKVGPRAGTTRLVVQVRPDQVTALVSEADRRRDDRGGVRSDVSEVTREAIDGWMKRK